jgi:hypothetical protein
MYVVCLCVYVCMYMSGAVKINLVRKSEPEGNRFEDIIRMNLYGYRVWIYRNHSLVSG